MRAARPVAVATGLGLALGVLFTSGFDLREYGVVVLLVACFFLGSRMATLPSVALGLIAAPILVLLMLGLLFAVKIIRMPQAPLTGDGFETFLLVYAVVGMLGALIGRIARPRIRPVG